MDDFNFPTIRHWQQSKKPKFGSLEGDFDLPPTTTPTITSSDSANNNNNNEKEGLILKDREIQNNNNEKDSGDDDDDDDDDNNNELDMTEDPFYDPELDEMDQQFVDKNYNKQQTSDCTLCCPQCFTIVAYDAKQQLSAETKSRTLKNQHSEGIHFDCTQVFNVKINESKELSSLLQTKNNEYKWYILPNTKKIRQARYHAVCCDECDTYLGIREQIIERSNNINIKSSNSNHTTDITIDNNNNNNNTLENIEKKNNTQNLPNSSTPAPLWKVVETGMKHFEYQHYNPQNTNTDFHSNSDQFQNISDIGHNQSNDNIEHRQSEEIDKSNVTIIYHFNQVLPGML